MITQDMIKMRDTFGNRAFLSECGAYRCCGTQTQDDCLFLAWILPFKVERVCWSFPSIGVGTTRGTLGEICFSSVTGALKVEQCLWNFVARSEGIARFFHCREVS